MKKTFFPVQRSLLLASALTERMLPNYNLPSPVPCHFWRRGINDAYLVRAGKGKFVLRIAPANWRSYENLKAEIDLLQFLRRHQITVPQPIQQRNGDFIQTLNAPEGPRFAILFTFVPGEAHSPGKMNSYRFGQAIAQFHAITDTYPTDRAGLRFELVDMVDKPLKRLKPCFADHRGDFEYLLEISTDLEQAVSRLPREAPMYGPCHGDVNNGNFHLIEPHEWAYIEGFGVQVQ